MKGRVEILKRRKELEAELKDKGRLLNNKIVFTIIPISQQMHTIYRIAQIPKEIELLDWILDKKNKSTINEKVISEINKALSKK